jgi:transposase
MKQKSGPSKPPAETVVKHIRRRTRKQHSTKEKIRIVLEGLPARSFENHDIRRRQGAA